MTNLSTEVRLTTINSREVAEMVDKLHKHLIRDIEGYISTITQRPDLGSDDFFIESTYQN